MEYLATVDVTGHGSLRAVLEALRRSPQSGSLVTVLGRATRAELDILTQLRRSFSAVVVVVTEGTDVPGVGRAPITLVDARADAAFAPAWSSMVASHAQLPAGTSAVREGASR